MKTENFIAKRATSEDAAYIAAAEHDIFSDAWSDSAVSGLLSDTNHLIVCVEDSHGKFAGYAIACSVLGEAELLRIAIIPAFRRRGAAGVVLDFLLNELKGAKNDKIFLEVRHSNTAAQKLYTSRGFKKYHIRRNYYKNPTEDAVMMMLEL